MIVRKGPWQLKGSALKYKNSWMSVREDQVIRPDGKPGIYGVVTMAPGASVLAMDKDRNVYLTREYHYAVERDTLEVVSGAIDEGEAPLAAAKRELKEEAGITAAKWTELGVIDPFTATITSPQHLFLGEDITHGQQELEATEVIEIIKIPFEEAIQMALSGKITHGGSVAVILKAASYLNDQK